MSEKLKNGDTVRLKSGGPVMTYGEYKCIWFDDKEIKSAFFSSESLVRCDPDEKPNAKAGFMAGKPHE